MTALPTLRQLEYIVAVADSGQFVEAARLCAVSQPALSKQVREVEQLLGVVLFERTRPRVIVTQAGREVVQRARRLLADAQALVHSARPRLCTIHLGVIPTIAPYGLPGLLARLRRQHPELSFAIHELQTDVLLDKLRDGTIDLGLLAHPFDTAQLAGVDLVVEPFVLVAPNDHPLSSTTPIQRDEIAGASLILMKDGHCLRDQALDVCSLAGAPPPTSVTAASVSTLTRMVESGLGATLLPASALPVEVRPDQGLVVRSFEDPPPGRTLTLQWRTTSPNPETFHQIGSILQEHYIDINASLPDLAGPRPAIRIAGRSPLLKP